MKLFSEKEINSKELFFASFSLLFCVCIFFGKSILNGETILPVGNIFEQPFYKNYAPNDFKGYPNYLLFDQSNQFYPLQHYAMESLREGVFPLWNPNIMLGTSILGSTQTAVFYPINLLATVLSPTMVILIRCIFNMWIAGFLMFLLVRRLGANFFGSFISSVAFMFSGFLVVWLGHPHSNSAIWLPVLILLADIMVKSKKKLGFYSCLTSFFIAISFFGGHMETSFSIILAWFSFFMIRSFQFAGITLLLRNFKFSIFIVIFGFFTAAIQIIPFLEWLSNYGGLSDRSTINFNFFNFQFWRNLATLPVLILPNIFSNPSQNPLYQSYIPWTNFNEFSMYIGIIPFFISLYGLFYFKNNKNKIFTIGALFFLALSLKIPFFDYINQIPVFSLFKSTRYRLIFDFGMSVGAGLTINELLNNENEFVFNIWNKLKKTFFITGSSILILIVTISFILPFFEEPILNLGKKLITEQYATIKIHSRSLNEVLLLVDHVWSGLIFHFSIQNWKLYFPAIISILAGIWILLWRKQFFDIIIFQIGILLLIVLDLFVFGIGYNPSIKNNFVYPHTPAINFLKDDKTQYRILPTTMQWRSNGPMAYGINEIGGCELPTKYYHEFRNTIALSYPFPSSEYSTGFTASSANSKLIDLLNVKYIITTKKIGNTVPGKIELVFQDKETRIYKNNTYLPRAFFVNRTRFLSDDSTLKFLSSQLFDPKYEVILSDNKNNIILTDTINQLKQNISISDYKSQEVRISAVSNKNAFLVLSDAYYPGWKAYLDGDEVPIYRANHVMRAIYVPKGKHKILFKYEPLSIKIGIYLSLTSLVFMSIFTFFSIKKNK